MFRFTATILLLTAFATQTFQRTFMVLDYYANTGSFSKNCENRFRPQMHCNGQCVLMKKLKEQENGDRQNQERKPENKNEVVSSKSFFASIDTVLSGFLSDKHLIKKGADTIQMLRSFFHPPNHMA